MAIIPVKSKQRIIDAVKKYQPIIKGLKAKDINESDTVSVVTDILADLFGYDKYNEITSEYRIKSTFCDLAIKIDNEPRFLIEVKAMNLDLKADHIKQAVDYGSNKGTDWIILTNGVIWKVFKIIFGKPVSNELVYELNLMEISLRKDSDIEPLFMLSKESISKSILEDYHAKKQVLNKFAIGNLLITEPVLDALRKVVKKMNPEVKADNDIFKEILENEVIKREIFEGEKAIEAKKKLNKYFKSLENAKNKSAE
jgi:hypothetical protein